MAIELEQVFGVGNKKILSYYERSTVDGALQDALKTDKQIVVYGSSKQGKTSLVAKHLPYDDHIVVSLTPKFTTQDIYRSLLRKAGVHLITETSQDVGRENNVGATGNVEGSLPLFASAKVETVMSSTGKQNLSTKSQPIHHNIELPDDVADLLKQSPAAGKFVILENFHYLNSAVQQQLAYDLRSFQELGVRFVILGVWREKNHLTQFNGDLLDRMVEVPVEPWTHREFLEVIKKGEEAYNVVFSDSVRMKIIENAFDSIGVVQELLKKTCEIRNIFVKPAAIVEIDDIGGLMDQVMSAKIQDYSLRHHQSLEAIAQGRRATRTTRTGEIPLYLPYHTIRVILGMPLEQIIPGISQKTLHSEIKKIHHRGDDIKTADMVNLLDNFADLQVEKNINPPIFDYDRASKTLRVVDSTFYFFLRNVNRQEVLESLSSPIGSQQSSPAV